MANHYLERSEFNATKKGSPSGLPFDSFGLRLVRQRKVD